jgi:hypothetical protein
MKIFLAYLKFFLGTPQRFLMTLAGLFILSAAMNPAAATQFFENILGVILGVFMPIALVGLAIKVIITGKW